MSVLKQLRVAKGYTITTIAKLLDMPISTYAMLESGERTASKEVATKLGELLNVKPEEIFLPQRFTVRELDNNETSATKETA